MNKSSKLKSALVVVGGGLVATPAVALELGDVKVHSTLGQPLRASIAYALGPNEAISDTCVSLQSSVPGNGLPTLTSASMIVSDGVIAITGRFIAREPLMTMRLNVRCAYTPQLTREYMMFIDPASPAAEPIAAPVAARVASQPTLSAPATAPVVVRRRQISRAPISATSRYQVQPGDSLSEIVQRIENRPIGLWPAVYVVFDANPAAFIDNDPNKLKAGSWLTIPNLGASGPSTVADVAAPEAAPVVPATASTAYEPADIQPGGVDEKAGIEVDTPADQTPVAVNPLADLKPGDVIVDSDNPFVTPINSASDESVVIPDTALDGPVTSSTSPNVPVATIQTANRTEPTTTNWLLWFGGGGIALFLGILIFSRRFRDLFGSAPIAPATPQRRETDGNTQRIEAIGDVDVDIADDDPTGENLALDADLIIGTGLQDGTDVDVAQDFGFAATTDLDMELPEEMSSGPEAPATDIIPPLLVDETSILENEVLPENEDDYDMSVIVDATKMPHPDDVTERDLEAIQVDAGDDTLITGDYTVSQEVDYKIIEQDYEDEMTATQTLNSEIQKAAEEFAVRMDEDTVNETAEMPLATVHELDVTAQMPAKNKQEIADDEDTGVNPTVDMEAENETAEMREDNTIEMPKGGKKAG